MKLTSVLAAATFAVSTVHSLPLQPLQALSEVTESSGEGNIDATVQLDHRGTDKNAPLSATQANPLVKRSGPFDLSGLSKILDGGSEDLYKVVPGKVLKDEDVPKVRALLDTDHQRNNQYESDLKLKAHDQSSEKPLEYLNDPNTSSYYDYRNAQSGAPDTFSVSEEPIRKLSKKYKGKKSKQS